MTFGRRNQSINQESILSYGCDVDSIDNTSTYDVL